VKRLSEHLKFYAKDDYTTEEVIPIIEVNLRAMPHSKLLISPYKILFGRPMRIGIPGDPSTAQQATVQSAEPNSSGDTRMDPTSYYKWL